MSQTPIATAKAPMRPLALGAARNATAPSMTIVAASRPISIHTKSGTGSKTVWRGPTGSTPP
jgi:hypothetical protein